MAEPVVSVVVPARNAAGGIARTLDALAGQTLDRERFEVVVVDDASSDDTAGRAESHPLGPRVVRRTHAGGSYAARNDGIAAARGRLVAFTDADCVPDAAWLAAGLARIERGATVVAGAVELPLRAQPSLAEALDVARFLDQERAAHDGFGATANLFTLAGVLDEVGGFDARLRSGGDFEWCHRAQRHGHRLVFAPEAVVRHPPRTEARDLARRAFRIGLGMGQQRRLGVGPWGDRRPLWTMPRAWLPAREVQNAGRLASCGSDVARRRAHSLRAAQYALVHLPMLVGTLAGQLGVGASLTSRERSPAA